MEVVPSDQQVEFLHEHEKLRVTSQVQLLGLFLNGLMEEVATPGIRPCGPAAQAVPTAPWQHRVLQLRLSSPFPLCTGRRLAVRLWWP